MTDTERLVVGAIQTGQLQPATREQVEDYCRETVEATLAVAVSKLEAAQDKLVKAQAAVVAEIVSPQITDAVTQ